MKFRGIDKNGDVLFGQGLGSYATAEAAIALDIAASLRLRRGECFFAPASGVDYTNLLAPGMFQALQTAIQNAILQVSGVVKIVTFSANLARPTRASSVTANVQTVYSPGFVAQVNNLLGTLNAS